MAKWGQGTITKDVGRIEITKLRELLEELEAKGYGDAVIYAKAIGVSVKHETTMDGDGYALRGFINVIDEKLDLWDEK